MNYTKGVPSLDCRAQFAWLLTLPPRSPVFDIAFIRARQTNPSQDKVKVLRQVHTLLIDDPPRLR